MKRAGSPLVNRKKAVTYKKKKGQSPRRTGRNALQAEGNEDMGTGTVVRSGLAGGIKFGQVAGDSTGGGFNGYGGGGGGGGGMEQVNVGSSGIIGGVGMGMQGMGIQGMGMGMGMGVVGMGMQGMPGCGGYSAVPPGNYNVTNTRISQASEVIGEYLQKNLMFPKMPYLATVMCSVQKKFQSRYVIERTGPLAGWIQYIIRGTDGNMQYTIGPQFTWEKLPWREPQMLTSAPASVDTMCSPVFNTHPVAFAPLQGPQGDAGMYPIGAACPGGMGTGINARGQIVCNSGFGSQLATELQGQNNIYLPTHRNPLLDMVKNVLNDGVNKYDQAVAQKRFREHPNQKIFNETTPAAAGNGTTTYYCNMDREIGALSKQQLGQLLVVYDAENPGGPDVDFIVKVRDAHKLLHPVENRHGTMAPSNRNSAHIPGGAGQMHSSNYSRMFQ
jgi:hypothetical protein